MRTSVPSFAGDTFVTPAWLAARLTDPTVIALDASFYLPDENKDGDALFRATHIPGAVRFNVDAIADRSATLPHMLPDAATFGEMVGALGVRESDTIVIYDATDLLGGARAWWMLRRYGARDVRLLEGGFRAWLASDLPVEHGAAARPAVSFRAIADGRRAVVDADAVLAASQSGARQIVDARSPARFSGAIPEPRPGLRAGHIPTARNVPWRELVDDRGCLRDPGVIASVFHNAGVDIGQPIITSCGSGVSAAVLLLCLELLGTDQASLYDGSWAEWGSRHDLPVETGQSGTLNINGPPSA